MLFSPGTCRLKCPICVPESERLQFHSIRISKRMNNHLIHPRNKLHLSSPAGLSSRRGSLTRSSRNLNLWIPTSSALFGTCKSESLREDLAVTFPINLQGRKLVRHFCYSRNSVPQTHKLPTFLFIAVENEPVRAITMQEVHLSWTRSFSATCLCAVRDEVYDPNADGNVNMRQRRS